jgi:hypothetical protein
MPSRSSAPCSPLPEARAFGGEEVRRGMAHLLRGDLTGTLARFDELVAAVNKPVPADSRWIGGASAGRYCNSPQTKAAPNCKRWAALLANATTGNGRKVRRWRWLIEKAGARSLAQSEVQLSVDALSELKCCTPPTVSPRAIL